MPVAQWEGTARELWFLVSPHFACVVRMFASAGMSSSRACSIYLFRSHVGRSCVIVVGMWGLSAVVLSNPDATLVAQLTGLGVIFAWTFVASLVTWGIIKMVIGIRVSEEEEFAGVDLSECGLEAYPEFVGSQGSGK